MLKMRWMSFFPIRQFKMRGVHTAFAVALISGVLQACAHVAPTKYASNLANELSISELHRHIVAGETNCARITQFYLDRIQQFDQATQLNAITVVNAKAMATAQELDREFLLTRRIRPLHCVPVVVKDNVDTIDMPTSAGSLVFKNYFSDRDAAIVTSFKNDGAIVLAKTNMSEWAFSPTETISSSYGITRNAYDLKRSPAGSSGGTAAAIAANFAILGVGTDTGNSIRGPASHQSLVGLRPSIDRAPMDGIVPLLRSYDTVGLMARNTEDLALGLDSIMPLTNTRHYRDYLKKDGLKNIRVGVFRDAIDDTADFEIVDLFSVALHDLEKLGAILIDPFVIENFPAHRRVNVFCNRARYDLNQFFTSLGDRAPVKSIDIIAQNKAFAPQNDPYMDWLMRQTKAPHELSPPCGDVKHDKRRRDFLADVLTAMQQVHVDVIVYPTWNNPAQLLDDVDSPVGNNSSLIAPHTGQPAITIPMGFTNDGLPTGLQFLAKPDHDEFLLQYAYAYENATRHRKPPPLFNQR